jgi:hypothetical protein
MSLSLHYGEKRNGDEIVTFQIFSMVPLTGSAKQAGLGMYFRK